MRHLSRLVAAALLLLGAGSADAVLGPGDTNGVSITVGTLARQYDVHVPPSYVPTVAMPLVLDLHGYGGVGAIQAALSNMKAIADAKGFIVAFPNGYGPLGQGSWNSGACCDPAKAAGVDDVAFARAIVADVAGAANVDLRRVYATGLSNGGFMSHRLACEAADLFAAVAPVSAPLGVEPIASCRPSRSIPLLQFSGLTDTVVPYAGGPTSVFPDVVVIPALDSYAYWAGVDGCSGAGAFLDLGNGASLRTRTACADGVEVGLCSLHGTFLMGHVVYTNGDGIDVAQRIWDFLSRFVLPTNRPVDARKLTARRAASGRQTLVFVSRSPAVLFPAPGSPDDPRTVGAQLEIFSPAEGTVALALPAGLWRGNKAGTRYTFANKSAPSPTSPVKLATLRRGKGLGVTSRALGLPFAVPEGRVAVRVTMGSLRTCARFGGTIAKDLPGKFAAKNASAAGLADCSDATLLGP